MKKFESAPIRYRRHAASGILHDHQHAAGGQLHDHQHTIGGKLHDHQHTIGGKLHDHQHSAGGQLHDHQHNIGGQLHDHQHLLGGVVHSHSHTIGGVLHDHQHTLAQLHDHQHAAGGQLHAHHHDLGGQLHDHQHSMGAKLHDHQQVLILGKQGGYLHSGTPSEPQWGYIQVARSEGEPDDEGAPGKVYDVMLFVNDTRLQSTPGGEDRPIYFNVSDVTFTVGPDIQVKIQVAHNFDHLPEKPNPPKRHVWVDAKKSRWKTEGMEDTYEKYFKRYGY